MKSRKIFKRLAIIALYALIVLISVMNILNITNIHEFDKITFAKGTFKNLVLSDYFEESQSDNFSRVLISPYFNFEDDRKLRSQDTEFMETLLNELNAMKLKGYNNYDKMYDLMCDSYGIAFFSRETHESLTIYINDGSIDYDGGDPGQENNNPRQSEYILVEYDILVIWEEKDKKIIHYDNERKQNMYRVTGNKMDIQYLERLLDTYSNDSE